VASCGGLFTHCHGTIDVTMRLAVCVCVAIHVPWWGSLSPPLHGAARSRPHSSQCIFAETLCGVLRCVEVTASPSSGCSLLLMCAWTVLSTRSCQGWSDSAHHTHPRRGAVLDQSFRSTPPCHLHTFRSLLFRLCPQSRPIRHPLFKNISLMEANAQLMSQDCRFGE
jgi:hypothetical protein